jgi:hypothetical protein
LKPFLTKPPADQVFIPDLRVVSYIIELAMNIDEYVPTIIPMIIAKRNPLIVAPPKKNITISTRIDVIPVFIVRLRVSFIARFITSFTGRFL